MTLMVSHWAQVLGRKHREIVKHQERLRQFNLAGINVIEDGLRIDILPLKVESSQSTPFAVLIPQV